MTSLDLFFPLTNYVYFVLVYLTYILLSADVTNKKNQVDMVIIDIFACH